MVSIRPFLEKRLLEKVTIEHVRVTAAESVSSMVSSVQGKSMSNVGGRYKNAHWVCKLIVIDSSRLVLVALMHTSTESSG